MHAGMSTAVQPFVSKLSFQTAAEPCRQVKLRVLLPMPPKAKRLTESITAIRLLHEFVAVAADGHRLRRPMRSCRQALPALCPLLAGRRLPVKQLQPVKPNMRLPARSAPRARSEALHSSTNSRTWRCLQRRHTACRKPCATLCAVNCQMWPWGGLQDSSRLQEW